ncbi:hypothetical protein K7X08_037241 [Anisodus acutangulus]|uniref:Uncharacterized protein n=1 Tax=Anisodus acutangulus TaxID=402998 RepID=A0A9Q1QVG2_9SOLA|nr:hypothetical protein K7X08_037241 [Anisodus acutangulus]
MSVDNIQVSKKDVVFEAGEVDKVTTLGSMEDQDRDRSSDKVTQDLSSAEVIIEDLRVPVEIVVSAIYEDSEKENIIKEEDKRENIGQLIERSYKQAGVSPKIKFSNKGQKKTNKNGLIDKQQPFSMLPKRIAC